VAPRDPEIVAEFGDVFALKAAGADLWVLVLAPTVGRTRPATNALVVPLWAGAPRTEVSTLDVLLPPDANGLDQATWAAAWATSSIPIRALDRRLGHVEDARLLEAIRDARLALVDDAVRPDAAVVGAIPFADDRASAWHAVVRARMEPYWTGTFDAPPVVGTLSAACDLSSWAGMTSGYADRASCLIFDTASLEACERYVLPIEPEDLYRRAHALGYYARIVVNPTWVARANLWKVLDLAAHHVTMGHFLPDWPFGKVPVASTVRLTYPEFATHGAQISFARPSRAGARLVALGT
jgi:mRNA-degrading endonuclease toxin of MazEF toxin-antitoxin module